MRHPQRSTDRPSGRPGEPAPAPLAVELREATPADAEALAELRYDFRAALAEPVEERAAFLCRCREWMVEHLTAGSCWHCWIAAEDGAIVGMLWFQVIDKVPNPVGEPERHAYCTNFYVLPAARGRGIGTRLFGVVLERIQGLGVDSVILWPTRQSRSLYARHGFAVPDELMERPRRS